MSIPRLFILLFLYLMLITSAPDKVCAQNDGIIIESSMGSTVDAQEKADLFHVIKNISYTDTSKVERRAVLVTSKDLKTGNINEVKLTIDDFDSWNSAVPLHSIRASGAMVWLEDTLCFIVGLENTKQVIMPYLAMLVDVKLVKKVAIPMSSYTKVFDIFTHLNTLIVDLEEQPSVGVLYSYSTGKVKELRRHPSGETCKLLPHPILPSFVMLNKKLTYKKSELILTSYDFYGELLWQKDYSSNTYHIPEFDIAYVTNSTLTIVAINTGHLGKSVMNPYNQGVITNYGAAINVYQIWNANGEIFNQVDVSRYIINKLYKAGIFLIKDLCIAVHPKTKETLITFQQFTSETEGFVSSFIIDADLNPKGFRRQDSALYNAGITSSQALRIKWNNDGSYSVYGRRFYKMLFFTLATDHYYRTNIDRCLKKGSEQYGCTDSKAKNFDPQCTINNGSCVYTSCADDEFELVLQSDHTFLFQDTSHQNGRTSSTDILTITGQSDGIKYLEKSIGEMCKTVSFNIPSQTFFQNLYYAQCLPKYNACYRFSFSNPDSIPIQEPFKVYAQIDHFHFVEQWVTKDFTLNINGFNDKSCDINSNHNTQIYPNPSSEFITIHKSPYTLEQDKLELFDIHGKLVLSSDLPPEPTFTIPVSSITNGMYWMRIWSTTEPEKMEIFKFIKL